MKSSITLLFSLLVVMVFFSCRNDSSPSSPTEKWYTFNSSGCLNNLGKKAETDRTYLKEVIYKDSLKVIIHQNSTCCMEFLNSVEQNNNTIQINCNTTGAPCDCNCPFDNKYVFHGQFSRNVNLIYNLNGSEIMDTVLAIYE